jgi:hypothetical protein
MTILLNDILNLKNLENTKIRFIPKNRYEDPLKLFKRDRKTLLNWLFWNYGITDSGRKIRQFKVGQTAIGLLKIEEDKWLLFDISKITKELDVFGGVGYEYEQMNEFEKYFGRVVIEYKNKATQMNKMANTVIRDCKVLQILEDIFDDDFFPGYENVNKTWKELQNILNKVAWKTALENQKGVYLITDKSNGKMYVGAAYGENMIYGRWSAYIKNGHGENAELRALGFSHIKDNFCYSILNIYPSNTPDKTITDRESWWKETLQSRKHGYNGN